MLRTYLFGTVFGFLLARVGATDYDTIAGLFLFRDPQVGGVMAVAIGVAALGFLVLRRTGWTTLAGDAPPMTASPARPGLVPGALLFGVGWGLTGSCPGTAVAQLGEGHLMGLFTVLGLFAGTAFYLRAGAGIEAWLGGPGPVTRPELRGRARPPGPGTPGEAPGRAGPGPEPGSAGRPRA